MITYRNLGRNGRLGNQLWQIASTSGIARARGDRSGFPFWRYRPYFRVPGELFVGEHELDGTDLGRGYYQDLFHLQGVEKEIRAWFRPSPAVWKRLARRFAAVLDLPHRTAVHVRRGDYIEHSDLFTNLGPDYYREAMALTQGPYLVFSDDLDWCRRYLPDDSVFMDRNRDYEDLFLMTSCQEHVIANSTFSWWGAWLAQSRRTVCPAYWGSVFEADTDAFVPSEWIRLDSSGMQRVDA
jgi:hypothetical protein